MDLTEELLIKQQFTQVFEEIARAVRHGEHLTMSQEQKTQILRDAIDSLAENTLKYYIDTIIFQVNMKEEETLKYKTTDEQVESILKKFPRLEKYRSKLEKKVKQVRAIYIEEIKMIEGKIS